MSTEQKIRALPPFPDMLDEGIDTSVVTHRTVSALAARNHLLAETLANVCEAFVMLGRSPPPGVDDILKACKVA